MAHVVITGTSADVLNAIRNSASVNYRGFVPYAADNAGSVKEVGGIIMQMPMLQNEFIENLVNLIANQVVTSKLFDNPWRVFKRQTMGYGATEEEIFVDLAKAAGYDPGIAEAKVFERVMPDVRAAFHTLNSQVFYKTTIQQADLRKAFLSENGINELVSKITESLYTSANYDEFCVMKYLLASNILKGLVTPVDVSSASTGETLLKEYATAFRATSNRFEFLSGNYNPAGVHNHTLRDNQYLIMQSDINAAFDVNVLASSFNMDRASFLGHLILCDNFGTNDYARLKDMFGTDGVQIAEPSSDEITALNAIPGVIVDENWFRVYDNLVVANEIQNQQGLYWNYFLHVWKTYSVSPFAQAAVFVPTAPNVTAVTVSPSTATLSAGGEAHFTATVTYTGFAPHGVTWSISGNNSDDTFITSSGGLHIAADEDAETITVTAKSAFKPSVTGTATVTIS